ncbi:MAG: LPS export ABC transporter periplasmic protein LptC [Candidatus Omnitrophica bacterium]|nr:LPS export ABC transporter periplasmic protein LptC [Candidatus Omnitrophota bacterium]
MRRVFLASLAFVVIYFGIVKLQIFFVNHQVSKQTAARPQNDEDHKIHVFSFTKYSPSGAKEIEIEGDSANLLDQVVLLSNVMAKAYAEEAAVTITSDKGKYYKTVNKVDLEKNVVATTDNGTRLLTEQLTIHPSSKTMETDLNTEVKKDNINIEGLGASGDTNLKKVQFKKNVTVVIQDMQDKSKQPTMITCDGTLVIDYEKNIAHFQKNVVAKDERGILHADLMDVYYNKISRHVAKIVALHNVVIENPDGNKTYSDSVIYLADEGRVILGGDTEALYYDNTNLKKEDVFI